ncbi:MAG TPA: hypothetical protein VHP34_09965 [Alphaproteobacteria bacterium]|nr:hypothetical protein [Alphaproteobacteria bacterium]
MKKDQDEKLESLRGKAMKAFRKIALPVLATVALAGGMVTEANAQTTQNTYGTVVSTQQVQQQKPWANDPVYLDQIRLEQQKQDLRLQEVESRARARIATYNSNIMNTRSANVERLQRLRKSGANALEILAHTQRMSAAEIQHNTRVEAVKNDVLEAQMRSVETMRRYVERLDVTYSRQSPYKEILQQQKDQQQQRVTTATARVEAVKTAETTVPRTAAEQEAAIKAAQEKYQQEQLRKFQDAQIKAASEGKPLPNREDFGLQPEQPQKQRVSTASLDRN